MVYRMFCLLSHYRKPLEFSEDILKNVANSYNKLIQKVASLKDEGEVDENAYTEYDVKFAEAMGNDINTSSAITVLYDMLKEDFSPATKRKLAARFDEVLSLGLTEAMEKKEEAVDEELAAYVEKMIQERKAAKKEKNFARADEIRDELAAKGIVLKDTREGTLWQVEK